MEGEQLLAKFLVSQNLPLPATGTSWVRGCWLPILKMAKLLL